MTSTHRIWLAALAASCLPAQTTAPYVIYRAPSPVTIDGRLDEPAWKAAPPAGDFHFNWWTEGDKEQTVAKLLWDDDSLYVSWYAHDRHISAYETKRHGPVSRDDCVEIFLAPNPSKPGNYYTFEINAIGTMLNRARTDWWSGPPTWEPEGVRYQASYQGQAKKDEAPGDDHWVVELAVPLKDFARDAAHTPPQEGDEWRLNLNRLGGKTNPQFSSWSPIGTPKPNFHSPSFFGAVRFSTRTPPRQSSRRNRNPVGRTPEIVAQGRELFNRNCTMCHGLNGEVGDRAPAMAGSRRTLRRLPEDLFQAIRHGIPQTMMPATALPDGEVWRIVAFIQTLRSTAFDDFVEGDAAAGEALFRGKGGCTGCHMIGGKGGILGPDLSDVGGLNTLTALRKALTEEPAHIARGYRPVRITTVEGNTIDGLARNENNFSLQVMDRQGRLHLLLRDEIKDLEYGKQSIMPRSAIAQLSETERQNLLAYLSRQARSQEAARGLQADADNER